MELRNPLFSEKTPQWAQELEEYGYNFTCSICLSTAIDPVTLEKCEHIFCNNCLNIELVSRCPNCRTFSAVKVPLKTRLLEGSFFKREGERIAKLIPEMQTDPPASLGMSEKLSKIFEESGELADLPNSAFLRAKSWEDQMSALARNDCGAFVRIGVERRIKNAVCIPLCLPFKAGAGGAVLVGACCTFLLPVWAFCEGMSFVLCSDPPFKETNGLVKSGSGCCMYGLLSLVEAAASAVLCPIEVACPELSSYCGRHDLDYSFLRAKNRAASLISNEIQ